MIFLSKIVQNLDIIRYSNNETFLYNIKDSIIKQILKYRNHPSIVAIRSQCKNSASYNFTEVDIKEVEQLILNQDMMNKVTQSSDIPLKIVKERINHCAKNKVFHYRFLQFPADLVTFTEEICNGKLHVLCSGCFSDFLFASFNSSIKSMKFPKNLEADIKKTRRYNTTSQDTLSAKQSRQKKN